MTLLQRETAFSEIPRGKFPVVNIYGYVKKITQSTHDIKWGGVLMSKVKEPITILHLKPVRNLIEKKVFIRDIFFQR